MSQDVDHWQAKRSQMSETKFGAQRVEGVGAGSVKLSPTDWCRSYLGLRDVAGSAADKGTPVRRLCALRRGRDMGTAQQLKKYRLKQRRYKVDVVGWFRRSEVRASFVNGSGLRLSPGKGR